MNSTAERRKNFLNSIDFKADRDNARRPTLFEPFICDTLAEQLIWRRGIHLWNEPVRYCETMMFLRERTGSDVVCLDLRRFMLDDRDKILAFIANKDEVFTVITDKQCDIEACESIDSVAAVGGYGDTKKLKRPFIRMDGDICGAIKENADGYFLSAGIFDLYDKYNEKIALLGGIGVDFMENASPSEIYERCESAIKLTGSFAYALGSGGTVGEEYYLELISLLGSYKRYR